MKIEKLENKYFEDTAFRYDENRKKNKKWIIEDEVIDSILANLPEHSLLLDIPVGTGRFIPLYKKYKLNCTGMDISADMLSAASVKLEDCDYKIQLLKGSIFDLSVEDGSFDYVLSIRFMNWISSFDFDRAIKELARVSNKQIIVGVRTYIPLQEIGGWTLSGCLMLLRQILRRFVKPKQQKGLVFHSRRHVYSVFEKYCLRVCDIKKIENRKDGTNYSIYILNKDV